MAEAAEGPPERDVKDFQFQQLCKVRICPSPRELLRTRGQCLTCSSRFGLTFVTIGQALKVLQTVEFGNRDAGSTRDRLTHVIDNLPLLADVPLSADVVSMAISCDDLTLAVATTSGGQSQIQVFDIRSFARQDGGNVTPFLRIQLNGSPGSTLLEMCWNPAVTTMLVACLSDGSLHLYDVTDKLSIRASLPAKTCAKSMCWSPKGKQLLVGKVDGTFMQYDQDLKEKKKWDYPTILPDDSYEVIDVLWLSTFSILAAYIPKNAEAGNQPLVILINGSKDSPPTYANFEDICYGTGEDRHHKYFYYFLQQWDMVITGSSNASAIEIIGKHLDNKNVWEHWNLEDSARAECPLTDNHADTYPMGLAMDFTSQREIPLGDNKTHPACPMLLVLTTDGLIIPYYLVYQHASVTRINMVPETISTQGERRAPVGPSLGTGPFGSMSTGPSFQFVNTSAPNSQSQAKPPSVTTAAVSGSTASQSGSTPIFGAGLTLSGNQSASKPAFGAAVTAASTPLGVKMAGAEPTTGSSQPGATSGFTFTLGTGGQGPTGTPGAIFGVSRTGTPTVPTSATPTSAFGVSTSANVPQGSPFAVPTTAFAAKTSGATAPATNLFSKAVPPASTPTSGAGAPTFKFGQPDQVPSPVAGFGLTSVTVAAPKPAAPAVTPQASASTTVPTASSQRPVVTTKGVLPQSQGALPQRPGVMVQGASTQSQTALPQRPVVTVQGASTQSQQAAAAALARIEAAKKEAQSQPKPQVSQTTGPAEAAVKQEPSVKVAELPQGMADTVDNTFTKSILEEMGLFEKEMRELRARAGQVMVPVGSKEELRVLKKHTEEMDAFCHEVKSVIKGHSHEIDNQRTLCLDMFAMVEECRVREKRHKDPKYSQLLKSHSLDPKSTEKLQQLRQQSQVLDQGINNVEMILDTQWEEYQNQKRNKANRLKAPTNDAIYRVVKSNHNLIQNQRGTLEVMEKNLKRLKLYNKNSTWQDNDSVQMYNSFREQDEQTELSSLADSLLQQAPSPAPVQRSGNSSSLTADKHARLREHLSRRLVPRVKSTKPENLSMSKLLSEDKIQQLVALTQRQQSPERRVLAEDPRMSGFQPPPTTRSPLPPGGQVRQQMQQQGQTTVTGSTGRVGDQSNFGGMFPRTSPGISNMGVMNMANQNAMSGMKVVPPGGQQGIKTVTGFGTGNMFTVKDVPPNRTVPSNIPTPVNPGVRQINGIILDDITPPPEYDEEEDDDDDYEDEEEVESDDEAEDDDDDDNGEGFGFQFTVNQTGQQTSGATMATPTMDASKKKDPNLMSTPQQSSVAGAVSRNLFGSPAGSAAPFTFGATDTSKPNQPFTFGGKSTVTAGFGDTPTGTGSPVLGKSSSEKTTSAPKFSFATPQATMATGSFGTTTTSGSMGPSTGFDFSFAGSSGKPTPSMGSTLPKPSANVAAASEAGEKNVSSSADQKTFPVVQPTTPTSAPVVTSASSSFGATSTVAAAGGFGTTSTVASGFGITSGSTFTGPGGLFTKVTSTSDTASTTEKASDTVSEETADSDSAGVTSTGTADTSQASGTESTSNVTTVSTVFGQTSTVTTAVSFGSVSQSPSTAPGLFGKPSASASTASFGQSNGTTTLSGLMGQTSVTTSSIVTPTDTVKSGGSSGQPSPSGGVLFGQPTSATASSSSGTLFGQPTSTSNSSGTIFEQPTSVTSSGGTLFGQPTSTTGSGGTTFGQTTSTSSGGTIFGQPTSTTSSGGVLFGQPASTTTGGTVFGQPTSTTTGGTIFGQPTSTTTGGTIFAQPSSTTSSSGTLFGQPTSATSTGGNLFGQTNSTPSSGGTLFGQPTATTSSNGTVFGQPSTPASSNSLIAGLLGDSSGTTTTASGGIFGQQASTSSSGFSGLFNQGGSASTFGQTTTTTSTGFSGFGQTTTTSSGGGGFGFGQSPFGQGTANTGFGQPAFGQTSAFGQPSGSPFGQSASASSSGTSLFGGGGGGGGLFSGLGGKPSEEKAKQNPFGSSTFGTGGQDQGASTLFGSQAPKTFGSPGSSSGSGPFSGGGAFTGGGGGVSQTGFGVGGQQQQQSSGFGSPPSFGGTPGFGAAPGFGSRPTFGTSQSFGNAPTFGSTGFGSPGGAGGGGGIFGSGSQASTTGGFASFANSASPTFGALAQQGDPPTFGSAAQTGTAGGFGSPGFGASPSFGGQQQSPGFGGGTNFGANPSFTGYRS